MLTLRHLLTERAQAGDSLVEVTVSLAILSFVLLSSTVLTATAFRTGETATERLQVADVAQEQLEALRSFRDNSTWGTFETGIDAVGGSFHMQIQTGASTQWVPVAGPLTTTSPGTTLTVPTSTVVLNTTTPGTDRLCGYDFNLTYSFITPGGTIADEATGTIETRLANLKYSPAPGPARCP